MLSIAVSPLRLRLIAIAVLLSTVFGTHAAPVVNEAGIPVDKVVTVQPIQVCFSDGTECNSTDTMYPVFSKRVLAQAGIALVLLPSRQLNDPAYKSVESVTIFDAPGLGQSSNRRTLNVWFADEVLQYNPLTGGSRQIAGEANVGGNGAVINAPGVGAEMRLSTFVHEIGHNLGIDHTLGAAATRRNLMTEGGARDPDSDLLTQEQIDFFRASVFAVDAPRVDVSYRTLGTGDLPDADSLPGGFVTEVTIEFQADLQNFALRSLAINLPTFLTDPPGQLPATRQEFVDIVESTLPLGELSYAYREEFIRDWPSGSEPDPRDQDGDGMPDPPSPFEGLFPELSFDFGTEGMRAGDVLRFNIGVSETLRNEFTSYIARDFQGSLIDFEFDFGLSVRGLAADRFGTVSSHEVVAFLDPVANPAPFGEQYGPGEFARINGEIEEEPLGGLHAVPATSTLSSLSVGAGFLMLLRGWQQRRRLACVRARHIG